jgi:hypothetical protein
MTLKRNVALLISGLAVAAVAAGHVDTIAKALSDTRKAISTKSEEPHNRVNAPTQSVVCSDCAVSSTIVVVVPGKELPGNLGIKLSELLNQAEAPLGKRGDRLAGLKFNDRFGPFQSTLPSPGTGGVRNTEPSQHIASSRSETKQVRVVEKAKPEREYLVRVYVEGDSEVEGAWHVERRSCEKDRPLVCYLPRWARERFVINPF